MLRAMRTPMNARGGFRVGAAIALVLLLAAAPAGADEFEDTLARVDKALQTNPKRVPLHLLESCQSRRNGAIRLYDLGQTTRALRRLDFCKKLLGISDEPTKAVPSASEQAKALGEAEREARHRAAREVEQALGLEPDLANGLRIYRDCAQCHGAEGWGLSNGSVPQLAGQHRTVVVKQLADIRAGNRDAPLMAPYATVESMLISSVSM